ncbi:PP2C family serine/threonine-protein phosphatase [Streptomyces sp. NBC_01767]|uniref:PP2C family serine/threonine-protein phosphatase n=1 Tax=Streptomyces sp. NBC_01767 TaxID=2975937 RepID=UPI0022564134|nr:PP2C family serine/threonine-protein phosphatase [Streptomyces sp. NBC_01767]MCX4392947.1 protein phosphatase 2C domain-containing protein [Streptomyces sp. NBC_01767]WSC26946.1 protein phosphatase 2C domain-containing protein [Streptomyces sp. NBC_01768]
MSGQSTPLWETLDHSVRGVNKRRNQDWCSIEGTGTAEDPLILVVADGHGSAAHARSDIGARYAVDLFTVHAREFACLVRTEGPEGARSLSWLMNYARNELPRRLIGGWQEGVLDHWSRHPAENMSVDGSEPRDDQKVLLYGATLIGAVMTSHLLVAWQLGDGELTVVEEDGKVSLPLAPANADLGDETESLCSRRAWQLVRVHWAPIVTQDRTPRMIALSTDGLSKSFASDEGFTQFMSGLDQRLSEDGLERVRAALPEWLGKATRYSGDDTTLVAARRPTGGAADGSCTEHNITEPSGTDDGVTNHGTRMTER